MNALDCTDREILELLCANAKLTVAEIAEQVNLSATPTTRRIKRLEDNKVITGYHAQTSAQALGYHMSLFVAVSMDRHTTERFAHFEQQISQFDEVLSCSLITGRSEDYLLKVVAKDTSHYEDFLGRLSKIDGVSQIHTSVELREVLHRSAT
ncbi:MAG: Lrp/AsnC family transcriptional regulator [Moraxella sp.]|nr:Lrp/AsnC family transcriptional regulator [Moraxella sp.]